MSRREKVSLREELSVIKSYLELQKMRHEQRLSWEFRIDPGCEEIALPPMLFHQLVENAVKHGVEQSSCESIILLEACMTAERLLLRVSNPGNLCESMTEGTGLHAIREELETLYGGEATFTIHKDPEGQVVSELTIPLFSRVSPPA
jgi:LytS/YehU family sensor histidine kinase